MLSHEIVNSEPYTFLDDAPLEERRARQVQLRRGLPVEARDLSHLDEAALEKIRVQVAAAPRSAEELHDLLLSTLVHRAHDDWREWFQQLVNSGRAMDVGPVVSPADGEEPLLLWCGTERRDWVEALYPGAHFEPDYRLPSAAKPNSRTVVASDGADGSTTSPKSTWPMWPRHWLCAAIWSSPVR